MKIRLFFLLAILTGSQLLVAATDPFYLQMLEKGKNLYSDNQFEPALENLLIAEFGLLAETEYLKEIYALQALCHFKLNRPGEVQKIIDKIRADLQVSDISTLEVAETIRPEWERLLAVMGKKTNPPASPATAPNAGQNISLMNSFESIYQAAREMIRNRWFDKADAEIKKLKKINKKDVRIGYLQARICFENKKYPDCVQGLRSVYDANLPELRDEVLYYLVISYYFTGNYGQALAFFQKIENKADRQKLDTIILKVKSERQQLVDQLALKFSRNGFKNLVDMFEGDAFLANDIFTRASKTLSQNDPLLEEIIRTAARYPRACDLNFYLNASKYHENEKKFKSAIAILKDSRYYNSRELMHIEVLYRMGKLYFQIKQWNRAMVEMSRVKAIKEGYKDSNRYLEDVRKLLKQGG